VLRRIFGPKRDEVTREWRKLHNEEQNNLCSTSKLVRVIKSRRMIWAEHVALLGEKRGAYRLLWENVRERDHLGDPGIDGRMILRRIFRKWNGSPWTGLNWLRIGTVAGYCECGNEPLNSVKCREFLD